MNETHETHLERQLGALTQWSDEKPDLWKTALEHHEAERAVPLLKREFRLSGLPGRMAAVIIVCLIGLLIVLMMLPSLGKAREQSRETVTDRAGMLASPNEAQFGATHQQSAVPEPARAFNSRAPASGRAGSATAFGGSNRIGGGTTYQDAGPIPGLAERQVVRKSTIELVTEDVRTAFVKASMLASEANSEYVEQSSLTGKDEHARANLTLRVSVTRLSTVLNQLRELGEVEAESTIGEDVTAALVDIDARLGNERRVEQELLELLESRNDAPLEDILALRQQINNVRIGIERLSARRQHMGRLVSLATILVIIKPPPMPDEEEEQEEEPEDTSIGSYFKKNLLGAWTSGLRVLADTAAFLLKVLVGGILWWITLIVVLITLRLHWRRRVELGLV